MEFIEKVYKLTQVDREYIIKTSIVNNEIKIVIQNNQIPKQVFTRTFTVDIFNNMCNMHKSIQTAIDAIQWIDNAVKFHKIIIYQKRNYFGLVFEIIENGPKYFIDIPLSEDNEISSELRSSFDTLLFNTNVTFDYQSPNKNTQEANKTPKTPLTTYFQSDLLNDKNDKPSEVTMKEDKSKNYSPQIKSNPFLNNEIIDINPKKPNLLEEIQRKLKELELYLESEKIKNKKITTSYENIKNTNLELARHIKELKNKLSEKDIQINIYKNKMINANKENNEINILLKNYVNQIIHKENEIFELQKKLNSQKEEISSIKNKIDSMSQKEKNNIILLEKSREMISNLELKIKNLKLKDSVNLKNEEMTNKTINDLKKKIDEINKNFKEEKIIYENKINEMNKYIMKLNKENDNKMKEIEQKYSENLNKEKENNKILEEKYKKEKNDNKVIIDKKNKVIFKLKFEKLLLENQTKSKINKLENDKLIFLKDRPENVIEEIDEISIIPKDKEIFIQPIFEIELVSKDRPENLNEQINEIELCSKDRPENVIEEIDEIQLCSKDRPENLNELIDEIELCSKDIPENLNEQIDEITLFSKDRPENIIESIDKIEIKENFNYEIEINKLKIINNEYIELKNEILRFPFRIKENEKIILIIIMTKDEKVIFPLMCKNTYQLKKIEELFCKEYPEFFINKGQFYFHNNLLNTDKTLEEYKKNQMI